MSTRSSKPTAGVETPAPEVETPATPEAETPAPITLGMFAEIDLDTITLLDVVTASAVTDGAETLQAVEMYAVKARNLATVDKIAEETGISRAKIGRLLVVGALVLDLGVDTLADGMAVRYVFNNGLYQSRTKIEKAAGATVAKDPDAVRAFVLAEHDRLREGAKASHTEGAKTRAARPDNGAREDQAPVTVSAANLDQRAAAALSTLTALNTFARESGVSEVTDALHAAAVALAEQASEFAAAIEAQYAAEHKVVAA